MIIKIFTGPLNYDISHLYSEDESEFILGVDQACKLLMDHQIHIDLALGDFDSISSSLQELDANSTSIKKYPSIKNYTDTYLAVQEALTMEHDEIIIYGGTGNRFDHTFANIQLLRLGRIKMINDTSEIYLLDPGIYNIENDYKYVSFFAIEEVDELTLKGFKYEVEDIILKEEDPLCISNEGSGTLEFKEGLLLVIKTNE